MIDSDGCCALRRPRSGTANERAQQRRRFRVLIAVRNQATFAATTTTEHFFAANALHWTLRAFAAKKCSLSWPVLAAILAFFLTVINTSELLRHEKAVCGR